MIAIIQESVLTTNYDHQYQAVWKVFILSNDSLFTMNTVWKYLIHVTISDSFIIRFCHTGFNKRRKTPICGTVIINVRVTVCGSTSEPESWIDYDTQ